MAKQAQTTTIVLPDQVVLIHGTGNLDAPERGIPWWQAGSEFSGRLERELSGVASVAEPFRWSGRNSERDRRNAAKLLLARVLEYEAAEQPYHLVAHSHGGSVIWAMLQRATLHGKALRHLRSWTTLGTPFLTFTPLEFSLLRIAPALMTFFALAYHAVSVEPRAVLSPLVVARMLARYWGDVWATGDVALLVLIPSLVLVWIAAFLWSATYIVRLVWGGVAAPAERRIQQKAFERHVATYLGVWSRIDEAINGLRSSMSLSGELTPRMRANRATLLGRLLSPVQAPVWAVYNIFFARAADEFAWETISLRLQGADVGGVELVAVAPTPDRRFHGWPALPESLDESLSVTADVHATATLKTIRDSLGMGSVEKEKDPNVVASILSRFTFQELVHTSYYRRSEILDLVIVHIRACASSVPPSSPAGGELAPWYAAGRTVAGQRSDTLPPSRPRPRLALLAMRCAVAILMCVAPWLGLTAIYRGSLWPLTNEFQIQSIVAEAPRIVPAVYAYEGFYWFRALAASGLDEAALKQAREAPGILAKEAGPVSAFVVIASTLRTIGKDEAAKAVEQEATNRTLSINHDYERKEAAKKLAIYLAGMGILEQRLLSEQALGARPEDELAEIAVALAKAGLTTEAVKLVSAESHPATQINAFDALIDAYLRAGNVGEAVKLARSKSGEGLGHNAAAFMRALVAGAHIAEAEAVARKAKANLKPDPFSKGLDTFEADKAYAGLALALVRAGNLKSAAAAASEVLSWQYSVDAGAQVAQILKRGGLTNEAVAVARRVVADIRADNNYWWSAQLVIENVLPLREAGAAAETNRALDELLAECIKKYDGDSMDREVLGRAVQSLIKAGDARRAFRHASNFRSMFSRGKYLSLASAALQTEGFLPQAATALTLAIEAHDSIVGDEGRSEVCAEIAGALARRHEYRLARLRAMSCLASKDRIYAFGLILLENVLEQHPEWRAPFSEFPIQN